jgi:mono/diheme cytochrome c family protein
MNTVIKILVFCACIGALAACDSGPKSARGFRLPDGDVDKGQAVFIELQCISCHRISEMELPAPTEPGPVMVILGGESQSVKTYGELVSSIINPSHKLIGGYPEEAISRDGKSLMTVYNDRMTVQQLIDLVAFLQSKYEVVVPEYTYYGYRY